MKHILIADDDHNILSALKMLLSSQGYKVSMASQPEQALELAKQFEFDAILLDLNYSRDTTSGQEGIDLIKLIRSENKSVPIIVMTGWATIDLAVNTMQEGASDFIQKPWENDRLLQTINTHLRLAEQIKKSEKLIRQNEILKSDSDQSSPIIAQSNEMKYLLSTLEQIASSDLNVVITGDNGTGKSLLAEYLHNHSERSQSPFISVNMGAISESLFESEMFGHIKGAFTDAKENRIGRFELADKGSLFLDEIGNIPTSQQSKLLRVLESQQFEPVGSSKTKTSDVRIIAATNADIQSMLASGEFRQDLYYRLNGIEVRVPSLSERPDDILPLAEHFLKQYGKKYQKPNLSLSKEAEMLLVNYSWPGNIRELRQLIERAAVLAKESTIQPEAMLMPSSATTAPKKSSSSANNAKLSDNDSLTLEDLEKQIIQQRIQLFDGNMLNAAKSLGLSRSAFYRRIDKYNL
ncbi:sigma-54-dependent transcriptional regulator [Pleionea sediminis]|uniref:sigma-54-dependent transcriptional regulator n=1 Tax=Pleionea sediminis TaxID=2569479 RepID=UPI00118534E9|nr:sigma-54 dependent transcriptional regulator [Pleionea sediminis]